jgi:hypothetical protein
MKKLLLFLFFFICTSAHAQTVGLNYQTYAAGGAQPSYTQDANGNITNRTLLTTGTVSTVDYNWGGGGVLNSRYSDGVIVRFYGYINIPVAGTYQFGGNADDGIRIKVNNTPVVNSWIESGGTFRSGSVNLPAGIVPIEVMYYENGGGALVNLQWLQNGSWGIVPSTSLAQAAPVTPTYTSAITAQQQAHVTSVNNRLAARTNSTPNEIYVNQVGSNNTFNFTQNGPGNLIDGAVYDINTGVADYTKYAPINGSNNQITVRQGDPGSRTGKNIVDLAVTGAGNILNLNQGTDTTGLYTGSDQGGHYQFVWVNGTNNYITTEQLNSSTNAGHFASIAVQGDLNTVGITQTGNAQKQLFASVNGTSNTVTTNQSGSSAHYLDVKLTGNGNSAIVDQNNTGATGANYATINLINAGGPASVNLTQTGNQTYSISQTCVTAGGCGTITVKQGN